MNERSDAEGRKPQGERPPQAGISDLDLDERYFEENPHAQEWVRPAVHGEWPEDNQLLTSPPFTLVIKVHPGFLLKLGAWRTTASTQGSFVLLKQGRIAISSYLDHLRRASS